MQFRRGAPWQRKDRTRPVLIATLVAIPLAVGVVVGVKVADPGQGGSVALSANRSGVGHHHHHRGTVQVGGVGMNMSQTPAQAAQSMNCTLQVPANPLSARGLATPYVLGDGCQMSNADLQAFVEADIINPRTGRHQGLQPAGDHPGHPARRPAGAAPGPARRCGRHHVRLQRRQSDADAAPAIRCSRETASTASANPCSPRSPTATARRSTARPTAISRAAC